MCNDIKHYLYTCERAMQGKNKKIENINCNINSFHYIKTKVSYLKSFQEQGLCSGKY